MKLLSIAITLFWLGMAYSLVATKILPAHRRAQTSLVAPEILAMQWTDIHDWFWIRHEGRSVGASVLSIEKSLEGGADDREHKGYLVVQNAESDLSLLGASIELQFQMTLELNKDFHVSKFAGHLRAPPLMNLRFGGFVLKDRLYFRVRSGRKKPIYRAMKLAGPLDLVSAIRPMVSRHLDLTVGTEYNLDVLSPGGLLTAPSSQARVKVAAQETIVHEGKEVPVYRVDTTFGETTRSTWVNDKGIALRREILKGYTLERSSKPPIAAKHPDLQNVLKIEDFNVLDFQALSQESAAGPRAPGGPMDALGSFLGGL